MKWALQIYVRCVCVCRCVAHATAAATALARTRNFLSLFGWSLGFFLSFPLFALNRISCSADSLRSSLADFFHYAFSVFIEFDSLEFFVCVFVCVLRLCRMSIVKVHPLRAHAISVPSSFTFQPNWDDVHAAHYNHLVSWFDRSIHGSIVVREQRHQAPKIGIAHTHTQLGHMCLALGWSAPATQSNRWLIRMHWNRVAIKRIEHVNIVNSSRNSWFYDW